MPALPFSYEAIGFSLQLMALYYSWRLMTVCRKLTPAHVLALFFVCFNMIIIVWDILDWVRALLK